jgi:hypothetical protein
MKFIFFIELFLNSFFIPRQEPPKIEIYLLNKRVAAIEQSFGPTNMTKHFIATKKDLQAFAFILDSDILSYDSARSNLKVNKSASLKIARLEPKIPEGIQFALTINKVPVICGYFINKYTSEPVISYMIMNREVMDSSYHIDKFLLNGKTDDRKSEKMIGAFKSTNRLK